MTWRRRLLSTVRLVGARATALGRVGVLVSRGAQPRVVRLSASAAVVSTPGSVDVHRLDRHTVVVATTPGTRVVRPVGHDRSTHLVFDPEGLKSDIRRVEQGLGNFFSGEHAAWMLRELGITCVLDVGANQGQYAKAIRAAGYTGRIVSFEPLPALVAALEAAAVDDPDWHVVGVALGERDEETEINAVPGTMSSLLPASDFGKGWAEVLGRSVPQQVSVRRLDGLFDEAVAGLDEPKVYLKMDTQGYDVDTFRGAGDRIHDIVGMQSEVSCVPIYENMPTMLEQFALYQDEGFALTGMFPVTIDRTSLRVIEFDAVFVRAAGAVAED